MANLADLIEQHILQMIGEMRELNIQRSNLASIFRCAPSQISYVLDTRFTPARGFKVESRRGGGGYIRIIRVSAEPDDAFSIVERRLGDAIDSREAEHFVLFLRDMDAISDREAQVMVAAAKSLNHPDPRVRDVQRAKMFRNMLLALFEQ